MWHSNRVPFLVAILTIGLAACQPHRYEEAPLSPVKPHMNYAKAAELNIALGLAYLKQGDVERARDKLLRASRLNPQNPEVYEALGVYYEHVRLLPRAEESYWKALSLAPESAGANYHFGAYLCHMQQYAKAEGYFQVALEDQHYPKIGELLETAGVCAYQAGNHVLAEAYLTRAVRESPKRTAPWLYAARYAYINGDYDKAHEYIEHYSMLPHRPNPDMLKLQFEIAEKSGDGVLAQASYQQLKTLFPNSSEWRAVMRANLAKERNDD
ncbi:MAG: type IV pilus biogenesis/stability protein PilW [Pseudomonadota bacterium]